MSEHEQIDWSEMYKRYGIKFHPAGTVGDYQLSVQGTMLPLVMDIAAAIELARGLCKPAIRVSTNQ